MDFVHSSHKVQIYILNLNSIAIIEYCTYIYYVAMDTNKYIANITRICECSEHCILFSL